MISRPLLSHVDLISIIHTWGLPQSDGYCYGYIGMLLPLAMNNKINIFVERLQCMSQLMAAIKAKDENKFIQDLYNKISATTSTTIKNLIHDSTRTPAQIFCLIINVIATAPALETESKAEEISPLTILRTTYNFCCGIAKHQLSGLFPDLGVTLKFVPLDPLFTESTKLQEDDSIVLIESFTGFYSEDDLIKYLSIDELLGKADFPFALLLENKNHAICKIGDKLFNANLMPYSILENPGMIIKGVINDPTLDAKEFALITSVFVKQKHAAAAKKLIQQWLQKIASLHDFSKKANSVDIKGLSWLGMAVAMGETNTVQKLLTNGANPNMMFMKNREPLLFNAVDLGDPKITESLLMHKADVNAERSLDGASPFLATAMQNKISVATLLLQHKADVNAICKNKSMPDSYSKTALHIATAEKFPDFVKFLLAAKADINLKTAQDQTALDIATSNKSDNISQLLTSASLEFKSGGTAKQKFFPDAASKAPKKELTEEEALQEAEAELERASDEFYTGL